MNYIIAIDAGSSKSEVLIYEKKQGQSSSEFTKFNCEYLKEEKHTNF